MRAQIPLILALLAAPLLVSATEVEEYFPIRVGASWTYRDIERARDNRG